MLDSPKYSFLKMATQRTTRTKIHILTGIQNEQDLIVGVYEVDTVCNCVAYSNEKVTEAWLYKVLFENVFVVRWNTPSMIVLAIIYQAREGQMNDFRKKGTETNFF